MPDDILLLTAGVLGFTDNPRRQAEHGRVFFVCAYVCCAGAITLIASLFLSLSPKVPIYSGIREYSLYPVAFARRVVQALLRKREALQEPPRAGLRHEQRSDALGGALVEARLMKKGNTYIYIYIFKKRKTRNLMVCISASEHDLKNKKTQEDSNRVLCCACKKTKKWDAKPIATPETRARCAAQWSPCGRATR